MQNAVIYARYSSHGQNEQTIEGQIRVCLDYAKQHKLNVIATYVDKHKTGTDVNRPQFQKMIADSAAGAFQYVIVYMIDRFARNRYYSTMYNFQLASNDVKLVSATENISESEEGEFYQMFLEWNAEKYSTRLSKRVKEGVTTSVANGTYTGGRVIYGYSVKDKRVYINPDEATVVQFIFSRYADGATKKEIACEVNARGWRHKGTRWEARDFDNLLKNAKYTGEFYTGGRLCANTFPAIIDKPLFEKVQERLKSNKYFSGAFSAKLDYLLQGKLYCGHCGASMVADGGTSRNGKQYHYYACTQKKKKHTCTKSNEQKEFLEWYATEQTVAYLSDPRRVDIIASDVIKYYELRTDTKELKRLSAERTRVKKEIDNAVNLMVSGVDVATVRVLDAKIKELSALLSDLELHQTQLELEQGLKVTKRDIVAFVAEFIKGDLHDPKFQKRIIDNLINAMYISDDRVVIYFNINNGRETSHIGKNDTDAAIDGLFDTLPDSGENIPQDSKNGHTNARGCVQTLSNTVSHNRQCLNTRQIRYIFVRGVAGIVIIREKGNQ